MTEGEFRQISIHSCFVKRQIWELKIILLLPDDKALFLISYCRDDCTRRGFNMLDIILPVVLYCVIVFIVWYYIEIYIFFCSILGPLPPDKCLYPSVVFICWEYTSVNLIFVGTTCMACPRILGLYWKENTTVLMV